MWETPGLTLWLLLQVTHPVVDCLTTIDLYAKPARPRTFKTHLFSKTDRTLSFVYKYTWCYITIGWCSLSMFCCRVTPPICSARIASLLHAFKFVGRVSGRVQTQYITEATRDFWGSSIRREGVEVRLARSSLAKKARTHRGQDFS